MVLAIVLALLVMTPEPCAAAGWFGTTKQHSMTTFQRDAAKAWQIGKTASKDKYNQAKQASKEKMNQAKESLVKASDATKKKGQQAAKEGKGLFGDIKARFGRIFSSK